MIFRYLTLITLVTLALNAQIYDIDKNNLFEETNTQKNQFFYGNFQEIIRFKPLYFNSDAQLTQESEQYLQEILQKLKKEQRAYLVTVLGHYQKPTDDLYEQQAASDVYARKISNLFESTTSSQTSIDKSKEYAQLITNKLITENIEQKRITTEYRAGDDTAYSDETKKGRKLSNRVMISVYIQPTQIKDGDDDKDGVLNSKDKCPNTPLHVEVDADGCPLDSDKDGVFNSKDKCPNTPKGVQVDKKGCALDDDNDGVANYLDQCPDTKPGFEVNSKGCPTKATLGLHFETNSYKILQDSYDKVKSFASFLKKNPVYEVTIIGHTDSSGSAAKNMLLSKNRASSTKKALINEGIKESRIKTVGKGEIEPIADNRTKEGRQKNRRIEVQLKPVLEGFNE